MNTHILAAPRLIEPGVRYFLSGTLKECRKFKENHTSIFFNIYMAGILLVVIGGFLLFRYRGKLTPAELELKNRKKHEYIINKLNQIAYLKKNQDLPDGMITKLPVW
jgi:antitoxin component YwqK of YwqJK toxin-antitoxin module